MSFAARSRMASTATAHGGLSEPGAPGSTRAKTMAEHPSSSTADPRWRRSLVSGTLTTNDRIDAGALTAHHARAVVYTGGNNQTTTTLSTGAMIGITCGSIVGSAVLLLLVVWLLRKGPWIGLCSRSKKGTRGENEGAAQLQRRENGEAARTGGVYQQSRSGRFASRWHARQSGTLSALWNPVTATTEVAMRTSPRSVRDRYAEAAQLENGDAAAAAAAAAIAEGTDEIHPFDPVINIPSNLWFAQPTPPAKPRAVMRKPWMEKRRQGEQKEAQVQSPLVRQVRRSTSCTIAGRSTPDTDVLFESSFYGAGDEVPPPSLPRTTNTMPPSLPQPYSGVHMSLDDTPCKGYETSGTNVLRRGSVELPAWAYMALEALAFDEDDGH